MVKIKNGKKYYRTNEACEMAGISRATYFRWLKVGVIKDVMYKDRRGWRLFSDDDIKSLKEEASRIKAEPYQPDLKFEK
ncbi:MAG: MerR family transcriptional regulator [Nitrospirota bacterium]